MADTTTPKPGPADAKATDKTAPADGTDRTPDSSRADTVLIRGESGVVLEHVLPLSDAIAGRVRNGQLTVVQDGAATSEPDVIERIAPIVNPASPRRTTREQLPNQDAHV